MSPHPGRKGLLSTVRSVSFPRRVGLATSYLPLRTVCRLSGGKGTREGFFLAEGLWLPTVEEKESGSKALGALWGYGARKLQKWGSSGKCETGRAQLSARPARPDTAAGSRVTTTSPTSIGLFPVRGSERENPISCVYVVCCSLALRPRESPQDHTDSLCWRFGTHPIAPPDTGVTAEGNQRRRRRNGSYAAQKRLYPLQGHPKSPVTDIQPHLPLWTGSDEGERMRVQKLQVARAILPPAPPPRCDSLSSALFCNTEFNHIANFFFFFLIKNAK